MTDHAHVRPPGSPVIDGFELTDITDADSWVIGHQEQVHLHELAEGDARQDVQTQTPGHPIPGVFRTFELSWNHIPTPARGPLLSRIRRPGEHSLVLWLDEPLLWVGDGVRTHFELGNGWLHAVDVETPPGGPSMAHRYELALYLDDEPVVVEVVDTNTWDGGSPDADKAWRLIGTGDLRLGTALAAGAWLAGHCVPVYRCLHWPRQTRREVRGPIEEPHHIHLRERRPMGGT